MTSCSFMKKTTTDTTTHTKYVYIDSISHSTEKYYTESKQFIPIQDTSNWEFSFECDSNYDVLLKNFTLLNSKFSKMSFSFKNGDLKLSSFIDSITSYISKKYEDSLSSYKQNISLNKDENKKSEVVTKEKFGIPFYLWILLGIVIGVIVYIFILKKL